MSELRDTVRFTVAELPEAEFDDHIFIRNVELLEYAGRSGIEEFIRCVAHLFGRVQKVVVQTKPNKKTMKQRWSRLRRL
jgi:hypothetical protein